MLQGFLVLPAFALVYLVAAPTPLRRRTGQSAADLELSSGTAVMAIGGWSGSDDAPTLAQFGADISTGEIHGVIAGSTGGGGSTGTSSAITTWVTAHHTATTVGGQTVDELTVATTS